MNQLSVSICVWQTVFIGLLVAPVFLINAQPSQHHYTNLIFPVQLPQYIALNHHQQQPTNNAKRSLETLNSREILSSNDDSNHNVMVNAEKPVDKVHRIKQFQLIHKPANYIDRGAKNSDAFFDEDGNKMRPHGQQGNVLSRQFIDGHVAMMLLMLHGNPAVRTTMPIINGNNKNVAQSSSFAEQIINNLAATNVAVNFSQSTWPNSQLPFGPQGIYASLDGMTNENDKNVRSIFAHQPQVIIINGPTRIYGAGTESKFPPFLEFFVQRIQKYFSVYNYEDLSRPVLPSEMTIDNGGSQGNVVGIMAEATTADPIKESTRK